MDGTLRSSRLPAVVLLILCTLPSRAAAQQFVCWPIAAGDTASSLARRLTGHADRAYGPAFQIRDPVRRMFVPKSHYERLQSDWQACVASGPIAKTPAAYAPVVDLAASTIVPEQAIAATPPELAAAPLTAGRADRTPVRTDIPFPAPIGIAVLLLTLASAVAGSLARRPVPPALRRAGESFIDVFARPLIDESSRVPPIQTRLRYLRRTQELEIFIAPGPGRRYPNLADHKTNVDYDVDRVVRVLGNCVLSRPPRTAGTWVVVTIRSMTPEASFPEPLLPYSLDSMATTGTEPGLGSFRKAHAVPPRALAHTVTRSRPGSN